MRKSGRRGSIAIPTLSSGFRMLRSNPVSWLIIALIVIFTSLYPRSFLSATNLTSILKGFAVTSMLSIGPTLVVLMGSLDLSYMGIWLFGGALVWLLFPYLGMASIIAYPLFGLALGFFNGIVQVKTKIPSFILTLAVTAVFSYLTTVIRNLSGLITLAVREYQFLTYSPIPYLPMPFLLALPVIVLDPAFWAISITFIPPEYGLPAIFYWSLLFWAVGIFITLATPFGRKIYAIGGNLVGARLAGINLSKVRILVFMLSSLFAGIAGILYVAQIQGVNMQVGVLDTIPLFASIVVGGTALTGGVGGIHRTLLGVLIIRWLDSGMSMLGIDYNVRMIVFGAVAIIMTIATIDRKRIKIMK